MNLTQIELLRILNDTGYNLSRAAEKMHLVQSAVSRQLLLLEQELGAAVVRRHGKKLLGPTPLGEKVLNQAQVMHGARQNIYTIAAEHQQGDVGTLRIATTHTQAKYFLPRPIQKFRAKHPKVKIYIIQSAPESLVDLLHKGEADLAICTEKVAEDQTLTVESCYAWHHGLVMQKHHPLATGPLDLERLTQYPVLTYLPGYTGRSKIEAAFAHCSNKLDIVLSAADSDVIKTYVRLGLGVGLIAGMAYHPEQDHDLLLRDLTDLIPCAVTKIAYQEAQYLPAYCQHFIDELRQTALTLTIK
ncbi:MAG: LysR substrate-binding domain-containing protein [Methylococcales bacterium]|nr:LysR substrate-binding domain-containing protein [Methylococcales bacterium]